MIDLDKITKNGKALFLAYDQGMEHGPTDFDDENVDPAKVLEIANCGYSEGSSSAYCGTASSAYFTGVILQKGIAEKYFDRKKYKVPLILKLNGKTNLVKDEDPYSPQVCSVQEALDLGASAVGYTIYIGSEFESFMTAEFGKIVEEAHDKKLPVIGWMYPRGRNIENEGDPKAVAYAARVGLELGADIVKVRFTGDLDSFRWVVQSAGRARVVMMGGLKEEENVFLERVKTALSAGAIGVAVGRNVWQAEKPLEVAEKIVNIIWGNQ